MQLTSPWFFSVLVTVLTVDLGEDYEGMMDALTDIQENGDNMMAGIW